MSNTMPITARIEEQLAERRLKRAEESARAGAVRRVGGLFRVTPAGLLGRTVSYDVRRNDRGAIVCSCPEFQDAVSVNPSFRCEHMMAVRIAIKLKMTEPSVIVETDRSSTEADAATDGAKESTPANLLHFTPREDSRPTITEPAREDLPGLPSAASGHERLWASVTAALETRDAGWSHSVKEIKQLGDMIVVTASITIDGVVRDGIGTSAAGGLNAFRESEIAAVRDAAVKFGIVVGETTAETSRTPSARVTVRVAFPGNPMARSLADLVTSRQLGMIRSLSREAGIDPEEETERLMHCATGELSRRAASMLIDHLMRLKSTHAGRARLQMAS